MSPRFPAPTGSSPRSWRGSWSRSAAVATPTRRKSRSIWPRASPGFRSALRHRLPSEIRREPLLLTSRTCWPTSARRHARLAIHDDEPPYPPRFDPKSEARRPDRGSPAGTTARASHRAGRHALRQHGRRLEPVPSRLAPHRQTSTISSRAFCGSTSIMRRKPPVSHPGRQPVRRSPRRPRGESGPTGFAIRGR